MRYLDENIIKNKISVKPFLKWAGGKTQIIDKIEKVLPKELSLKKFTYVEPFVGSGAILFWMLNKYPTLEKAIINDINKELINTYQTIADNPKELISILKKFQKEYHNLKENEDKKKKYYYNKRVIFNLRKSDIVTQSALFIFLNRTCFNGLYRVNNKNNFNVPIGSYKTPLICDENNLLLVSENLKKVEILSGDFENTLLYANQNSFYYLDPPYKPLNQTSSFNSYASYEFNDNEQLRLRKFCDKLNIRNCKWILSNSDVKGKDPQDNFFDDLYQNYKITRVLAKRIINANPKKRGKLNELLITNYSNEQALSVA